MRTRFVCFALLAVASHAHANWTLVQADAHPVVIHETSLYEAEAGQRLAVNDIVETHGSSALQIEDDSGNVVALGPGTRVLLARDAHIALLRGWLKALNRCDASANCNAPVIETAHDRYTPGRDTSMVIAASPSGYDDADALFCESGTVSVQPVTNARGKLAAVQLSAGQFAARRTASAASMAPAAAPAPMAVAARPDAAFVAAMPVAFRDALHALPIPKTVHDKPAGTVRPVAYDDISDWLQSSLAVRTQPGTRFTERFRARLSDPAFRHDVDTHLGTLPEWRVLLHPPPRVARPAPRRPASGAPPAVPPVYRSLLLRP